MQRLRQAEPSWLRSGQTTTLFSSETENEPVRGARGGMAASIYLCPRAEPSAVGGQRREAVNGGSGACSSFRKLGGSGLSCERPLRAAVVAASEGGLAGQSKLWPESSLRRVMRGFKEAQGGEQHLVPPSPL